MNQYKHLTLIESADLYLFVKEYLHHLLVIGRSEHTHRRYESALREFVLWCVLQKCNQLSDINRQVLKKYQQYLYDYRKTNGEPLSKGSKNSKLTPLKKFMEWCFEEKYILEELANYIDVPKKPRGIPTTILMHEAVEHILGQPDTSTKEGLRDRAIMEVLYSSAIRRSETVFLLCSDVDFIRKEVKIRDSKNGQPRVVPIYDRALAWISRYQNEARSKLLQLADNNKDDDTLFLSHKGIRFKPGTLASRVKGYIKQSGVETRGSCHLFRHSTATQMLENGANVRYIQALLGHKDLNTTEIYMRVANKKLKEVHAKTHPTTH